jgi:signal transduction histidine kinase
MTSPPSTTFRVLVADDEQPVLDAYRTVLSLPDPESGPTGDEKWACLERELFGGTEVVEKVDSVLPPLELVLCRQGAEAIEAVRRAAADDQPFAIAFLDVRMPPGVDGVQVAQKIREIDPNLHIVLVTGFSDVQPLDIVRRVPPREKLFYVAKPFQAMELQQLAAALSHKWQVEQNLVRAHLELQQRYADLHLLHQEAVASKARAELADRSKTEFLANMSHELRTPFNAIIGFAELMSREEFGPIGNEKYQSYIEDIRSSASHVLNLINDILDVSKIDANKLELDEETVDLSRSIKAALDIVKPRAHENSLILETHISPGLPLVLGDSRRLMQVILNLLSNAVKFTPEGGRVTVSATVDDFGDVLVAVEDNGIGIPPSEIDNVMAPFRQVEGYLSGKYAGTGLGLTIAFALTELHGGKLSIESSLGEGTTVRLRLPASRVISDQKIKPTAEAS